MPGVSVNRIAELRRDLLSAAEAASYRLGGREIAVEAADVRLAELRAQGAHRRASTRRTAETPESPDDEAA